MLSLVNCVVRCREGTMKVGDRILAINRSDVTACNLMEAVDILRHSTDNMTSLVVEYDVSYMGS